MVLISWLALVRCLVTAVLMSMFMVTNCIGWSDTRLRFVRLSNCQGKAGDNFTLKTVNNVQRDVECARICYMTNQCMLFFYNSMTRSCSLHNRTLTDIEMTQDHSSTCYSDDNIVESWITKIINVSSELTPQYPSKNMIGPSNNARWVQKTANQDDFIEAGFSTEMYIDHIHINEIWHAGGVREISLLTPEGTWYPVWSTDQLEEVNTGSEGRIFSPDLEIPHFQTSTVRIDIGARTQFEEIESVRVVGRLKVQVP